MIFDTSMINDNISKLVEEYIEKDCSVFKAKEPILVLSTLYEGERVVIQRRYFVIGVGSIIVVCRDKEIPLPRSRYLVVEQDAWGELEVLEEAPSGSQSNMAQ